MPTTRNRWQLESHKSDAVEESEALPEEEDATITPEGEQSSTPC